MTILEMIDEIDRLISNKGTVSQIKPLVITLREQTEAIEKRIRTLESKSKVKDLEGQVSFLRSELDSAVQQIQAFKDKEEAHSPDGPDEETRILLFLMKHQRMTARQISEGLQMGVQKAEFHLAELYERKMIYGAHYMGRASEWFIDQEGRRRLLNKGLLE